MKNPTRLLSALLSFILQAFKLQAAPLDGNFGGPNKETERWCDRYWLNDDISKEGVTKHLESSAFTA